MTTEKLQKILQSDEQLSLNEVKQILYELKNDLMGNFDIENKYEAGFNAGEINAFYICLDLLEKSIENTRLRVQQSTEAAIMEV
jgi:hypothetical protein